MKGTSILAAALILLFVASGISSFGQGGLVYTIAGSSLPGYTGDGGPATAATTESVFGTTMDAAGNVYLSDYGNNVIRKVDAGTHIIHTFAGVLDSFTFFAGDGGPATAARFNAPAHLVFDSHGNLFVNDLYNFRIRRIDAATGIITTFAGGNDTATITPNGIPATASRLSPAGGMAFDQAGNLYVATWCSVRKIDTNGIISTVVGTPDSMGYDGDGGPAIAAHLATPAGIAFDVAGNLYIADQQNERIRKVTPAGIISTIAGTGVSGYTGDGGPATAATIHRPYAFAFDSHGNLFFSDKDNYVIREINTAGIISTYAGGGLGSGWCYAGEGSGKDTTCLRPNMQLFFDGADNLYTCNGNRVSMITSGTLAAPKEILSITDDVIFAPNPAQDQLIIGTSAGIYSNIQIVDGLGRSLRSVPVAGATTTISLQGLAPGIYYVRLLGQNAAVVRQLVKM